jgi:nucleoside 2-deoxyribosyltransferase
MKVYIATGLEFAATQNRVRDALMAAGHEITYDWSAHGSVQSEGEKRIAEVAELEMGGVRDADVVIVLLPGGRGTHTELGMAIAWRKPVLVVAIPHGRAFHAQDGRTCAFYYAPLVRRVYVSAYEDDDEIRHVVQQAESLWKD